MCIMHKILLFLLLAVAYACGVSAQDFTQYVDPRIGSEGLGRTFPGPSMPFGMVKPGPDCMNMPNAGWAPLSEKVAGFSQTHVSGTGGGQKYGNILIQPYLAGQPMTADRVVPQRRIGETIDLGYYACTYKNGIHTEITTAERCALYRLSYPIIGGKLIVDASWFLGRDTIPDKRETQQFEGSDINVASNNSVEGWTRVRGGWNNGDAYTVYFSMKSDVPFAKEQNDGKVCVVSFGEKMVNLKIGISYISCDKARENIANHDFNEQLAELKASWQRLLSRLRYQGTERNMRMFYTALYHTMLMPVNKTGENPKWTDSPYYDDYYAIWDTYRTSTPLLGIYYPEIQRDIVNSLLNIYKNEGYMPDARSGDCNGRTQGGSHAEVVIADAFARGLDGIDYELALKAMIKDAEVPPADDEKEGRGGLKEYNKLGYVPYGIPRAGTRTVEYSFDDWCIAQVARGLGHEDVYQKYIARSGNWRNLWRSDYEWKGMKGFIMPRDAQGRWLDSVPWGKSTVYHPLIPYRPDTKVAPWYLPWWNTFFYEALSAEYSLSVPHDVEGLIGVCGGNDAFRRRLDTFFAEGHYNVANEPSFLTPWMYHFVGRPDLSRERVTKIIADNFSDLPDGLPGNDDGGAMSSWLIWGMLGKYPLSGTEKFLVFPQNDAFADTHAADADVVAADADKTSGNGDMTMCFILNRQYRNWNYSWRWNGGFLEIVCNSATYSIPHDVVDNAKGFTWLSPQAKNAKYDDADGTFGFISHSAYMQLSEKGRFVYDSITWRKVDETSDMVHVRADKDGTEMWISKTDGLPFVMKMKNNPLGIDWEMKR